MRPQQMFQFLSSDSLDDLPRFIFVSDNDDGAPEPKQMQKQIRCTKHILKFSVQRLISLLFDSTSRYKFNLEDSLDQKSPSPPFVTSNLMQINADNYPLSSFFFVV
jgi:hypothetical protein